LTLLLSISPKHCSEPKTVSKAHSQTTL